MPWGTMYNLRTPRNHPAFAAGPTNCLYNLDAGPRQSWRSGSLSRSRRSSTFAVRSALLMGIDAPLSDLRVTQNNDVDAGPTTYSSSAASAGIASLICFGVETSRPRWTAH